MLQRDFPLLSMYGREPDLPVDFVLDLKTSENLDLDKWVDIHQDKMTYALEKTGEEI